MAVSTENQTIAEMIAEAIFKIGENIQISRFQRLTVESGLIASYIHAGGRLGVLVSLKLDKPENANNSDVKALAKDLAMQVAAANPGAVSRADFAPELIEREMAIYKAQAAESGKNEDIQTKMAEGRLEKFYRETALIEQGFIKDPDKTIKQVIAEVSKALGENIEVIGFERFELGQA